MNYYARMELCKLDAIDVVDGKLNRGEIHTGPPACADDARWFADKDGRYHIEHPLPSHAPCMHCEDAADGVDGRCMFHSQDDLGF
jgi:hypothetical protein